MFIVFFEHHPKFAQKRAPKKTKNFSQFWKHRLIKKKVLLQPPLDQRFVFFNLCFLKPTTLMLKKHNWKSGKTKTTEADFKEKTRQKTKNKTKDWWKRLCNWIFWYCSSHETKAKKTEKERRREKQGTKGKQKGRTRRKKERKEQERHRERETEKGGGQKRLRRNKGGDSKINKKMPFLGRKQVFLLKQRKERQKTTEPKQK